MRYSASVNPGGAERLHQPPDEWRLETYWSDSAFPMEVFNTTLFNGRMGFVPFLPDELYKDFRNSVSTAQQHRRQDSKAPPSSEEPPVPDNDDAGLPLPGQVP